MRGNSKQDFKNQEEILAGCRLQEPAAQKALFKMFAPIVFTTCRRYETSFYAAKDILQDAFIKVFEKIHLFDAEKGNVKSWIIRIAINGALNMLRNNKIQFASLPDSADDFITDEEGEEQNSLLSEEEILSLIADLPIGYRTVFNLYVIDGYSHQEIADTLNVSLQTSKTQLFKAKKKLRSRITEIKNSQKDYI